MALEEKDLELIARALIEPLIERMEGGFARLEGGFARLEGGFARLEGGFARLESRFEGLQQELHELRAETRSGLQRLEVRIDQVVENTGAHWRDHEARIRRIELSMRPRNGHDDPDDGDDEN